MIENFSGRLLSAVATVICSCALLLVPAATRGQVKPVAGTRSETARPALQPSPVAPPVVELQAVPARESVERGEAVTVFLFVSNKSDVTLKRIDLSIPDESFEVSPRPTSPAELPPFGSLHQSAVIKPRDTAGFTPHKLPVTLRYAWDAAGREATSAQSTTITVQVRRRFEEESKGFPGGTAAFLYLLLPVIPALLGYQFAERLRKGEGVQMPTIKAEHLVPAFFVAVILSFFMLLWADKDRGLDYSNPRTFAGVLVASFLVGIIPPFLRGLWNLYQSREWGFKTGDTLDSYLRKALLSPRSRRRQFTWATGGAGGEQWAGILLEQPNGAKVLGARLEVVPNGADDAARSNVWALLTSQVLAEDGTLRDRHRLVEMVKDGSLTVRFFDKVTRGTERQDTPVVIDEVKNFRQTGSRRESLVRPSL